MYRGMFSKRNHMIKLRARRSQGVAREWGARACRNLNFQTHGGGAWGGRGLPGPKRELFTEFYVFWVLPGGSFPAVSEAQTHFCHS